MEREDPVKAAILANWWFSFTLELLSAVRRGENDGRPTMAMMVLTRTQRRHLDEVRCDFGWHRANNIESVPRHQPPHNHDHDLHYTTSPLCMLEQNPTTNATSVLISRLSGLGKRAPPVRHLRNFTTFCPVKRQLKLPRRPPHEHLETAPTHIQQLIGHAARTNGSRHSHGVQAQCISCRKTDMRRNVAKRGQEACQNCCDNLSDTETR